MPVVTRPVGGINDFFIENKMGYLVETLEPYDFSKKIKYLLENPDLCKKYGDYNYNYVKSHFLASTVAKNLEIIFKSLK